jgi:hypothetical protein
MCKFKIENPNTSEMRLSTRIVLVSAAVSVAALAIALAVYVIVVKVPTDLAHNAAEGMCGATSTFTPEVRLNETVVVQQSCAHSGTGHRLQVAHGGRDLHAHLFGQHEKFWSCAASLPPKQATT